jgi:hypothetical protein
MAVALDCLIQSSPELEFSVIDGRLCLYSDLGPKNMLLARVRVRVRVRVCTLTSYRTTTPNRCRNSGNRIQFPIGMLDPTRAETKREQASKTLSLTLTVIENQHLFSFSHSPFIR